MTDSLSPAAPPRIGEIVNFKRYGVRWRGSIVDIRPADPNSGTWGPVAKDNWAEFTPTYATGTRLAYVAVLGWPALFELDIATLTEAL